MSEVKPVTSESINANFGQLARSEPMIEVTKQVFEGWNVKRAILHQGFPLPGGGDTTTSMYATPGQTGVGKSTGRAGVTMKYNADGLFCEYKGHTFIIPLANVVGVYL